MNHRDELLQAFRIAPEDLVANRAGRLGESQRRKLLWSGTVNVVAACFLGFLLIVILYAVAERPLAPIQWILGSGLLAAVLIIGLYYFWQTRTAVADGRVECVQGAIRVSRRSKAFYANIAGGSYRLPIFPRHLRAGMEYRVYVVPQTQSVVAVEPA
ncbi:MAG: hypothetical protein U0350_24075 [Caldilineaceae bacterium]